jgi:hypothetical protein
MENSTKDIYVCKQNEAGNLVYQFSNGTEYQSIKPIETEGNIFFEVRDSNYFFGLADINGEIIIPCEEGEVSIFAENGKVYVQRYDVHKEKWGVIDSNKKVTIPFVYNDIYYEYLNEKLVFVLSQPIKRGLMDAEGNTILQIEYDDIEVLRTANNLLLIKQNGKWGVADSNGNIVYPMEYEEGEQCPIDPIEYGSEHYLDKIYFPY